MGNASLVKSMLASGVVEIVSVGGRYVAYVVEMNMPYFCTIESIAGMGDTSTPVPFGKLASSFISDITVHLVLMVDRPVEVSRIPKAIQIPSASKSSLKNISD